VKIAVIGGAGVRTPLLVNGLTQSDVPIREIALFDIDEARLDAIGGVARRFAHDASIALCRTSAEAIRGADFVFTSIRVGGIEQRARDEAASLKHGVLGQETIGPAGFAMTVRTIPALLRYAREMEDLAPDAWMINFTNPVGPVTQALLTETRAKVIGICDTPTELFEEVARVLGVRSAECHFDYFGLNHLGWLREVYHRGRSQLARVWNDPERLRAIYRAPLFDPEYLAALKLLPTEYVYYYVRTKLAAENIRKAGQTRGAVIAQLNARLFEELASPGVDAAAVYERYLGARNAGYMTIESGTPQGAESGDPHRAERGGPPAAALHEPGMAGVHGTPSALHALTGYDKIALSVVRAIHFNTGAVIPLNVRNNGNLPLEAEDCVEVPCVVNATGAWPAHVPPLPPRIAEFIQRVKQYERLTIQAAHTQTAQAAVDALAANPLVADRALAHTLYDALAPLW
jgi:6-phospho-beta-glucosidase